MNYKSDYMHVAWDALSAPKTKTQLTSDFAIENGPVSEKTVTNRLGEIHREIRYRLTSRGKQSAFVVLDDNRTGTRRYAAMPKNIREKNTIKFGGKTWNRSSRNRLRKGGYTAVIFERD
jgi:hypothetical protein